MRIFKLLATTTLIGLMSVALSTAADSYPNLCNFPLWLQAQGLTNGCVANQQWHNGVHAFEAAKKDGTLAHYTSVAAPAQTSAEAPASQPAASTQSSDGSNDPNMCNVWGLAFCTTQDHWVAGWFAHPDNGKTAEEIPAGNVAYIIAYTWFRLAQSRVAGGEARALLHQRAMRRDHSPGTVEYDFHHIPRMSHRRNQPRTRQGDLEALSAWRPLDRRPSLESEHQRRKHRLAR